MSLFQQNLRGKLFLNLVLLIGPFCRNRIYRSGHDHSNRQKQFISAFWSHFFNPVFSLKSEKKNKIILFWGVNIFDRLEVTGWPNVYPIASLGNKERLIDFAHQNMTHMTKILTKKFYYDNFSFEYKKNTRLCPGLLKQKSNFFFQFFLD